MITGQIDVTVGDVRVVVDSPVDAFYHAGHVQQLKRAVVQVCLAMDIDESRQLATRVEGTLA